jgi:hypothetical protein
VGSKDGSKLESRTHSKWRASNLNTGNSSNELAAESENEILKEALVLSRIHYCEVSNAF